MELHPLRHDERDDHVALDLLDDDVDDQGEDSLARGIREREQEHGYGTDHRSEVGDDDEEGREDGEEDRELEPDQRQPQIEEHARDEHVDHHALEPAHPCGPEAKRQVVRRLTPSGREKREEAVHQRLRIDRDVKGRQEHEDEGSEDANDAQADLGQRADQAGRILRVALEELLDALAYLLGGDAERVGHLSFQVVDGAWNRFDELLCLVDERRDDQGDDPAKMPRPRTSAKRAPKNRGTPFRSRLSAARASGIAMMIVIRIATTRVRSSRKSSPSTSSAAASSTAR